MASGSLELVGLVPAAGRARRLLRLPCSKELYPIGLRRDFHSGELQTEVVSQTLFDKFRRAGVKRSFVVVREGKWDIPAYFRDGEPVGLSIAYVVIVDSVGPPDTLDRAYPFIRDEPIAFGFPDILFGPDDAFVRLRTELCATDADVVLGLLPAVDSAPMDMIDLDETGRVRSIDLKPESTTLKLTWVCAVWRPTLTDFMHGFMKAQRDSRDGVSHSPRDIEAPVDLPVGAVIKQAVEEDFKVRGVVFPHDTYLDIGTPGNLAAALRTPRLP